MGIRCASTSHMRARARTWPTHAVGIHATRLPGSSMGGSPLCLEVFNP